MKVRIVSDGTVAGTKIMFGDQVVPGVQMIAFNATLAGNEAMVVIQGVECDLLVDAKVLDEDWEPLEKQ
jgi:hypothetical protein